MSCERIRIYFCCCLFATSLAWPSAISAQTKMLNPWVTAAQPAVPADPWEAVTGNAEPVVDVAQRAAAVKLLNNAQFLSNVRRSAYDLKTRFTSAEGTWQMEDSSPGRNVYRWTVQGPSYSAVNLSLDQVVYSNQPATAIPLRLAQVHSALFAHYPSFGPRATLRMASGNLNGTAVTCVLVSHVFQAQPSAGPRRWEEYESCVDPQTGFLMSYSPAPGLYVAYDYANAQHLGGITVPAKFSISEAGRTVVEAEVLSLTAPAKEDESAYSPAGLNALGVGFPLIPPWHIKQMSFLGKPNLNSPSGQFVVMRGMVSAAGTWTETEVLASSNPSLNQKALERVAKWHQMPQDEQTGATPQSHEAFLIMLFVEN